MSWNETFGNRNIEALPFFYFANEPVVFENTPKKTSVIRLYTHSE
jgi:hypothetical protein